MEQEDEPGVPGKEQEGSSRAAKIVTIVMAVLCAIVGISVMVFYFFLDVRLTDRARCEEILRVTMKRLQNEDNIPADKNGYYDFAPFCEKNAPEKLKEPYLSLSKVCEGIPRDIGKSLGKKREKTEKALKDFSQVLPGIEKTLEKPSFIIPSRGDYGLNGPVSNYLALRALAQSLATYGLYQEMQKNPETAVKCYILDIQFGAKLAMSGNLITQMISVAIQAIGDVPLHCLLAGGGMKSSCYKDIIARLESLPAADGNFLDAMDEEYTRTINNFDYWMTGQTARAQQFPVNIRPEKLKIIILREKKLYMNLSIKYRPCFETLSMPADLGLNLTADLAALQKKGAILCSIYYPNVTRALAHKKFILTRISALKILAALQAYKSDRGSYPPRLEDLCPGYLKEVPRDYMSKEGTFLYSLKDKSFTLASQSYIYREITTNRLTDVFSYFPPDKNVFMQ
ncbi:MAG: hypothetical protein RDV48_18995 [Candidatus Eremiobacteraeota bacterium]|nr:hypothetical protein [Candidatus Eremiobacteraeota bacterium]